LLTFKFQFYCFILQLSHLSSLVSHQLFDVGLYIDFLSLIFNLSFDYFMIVSTLDSCL